MPKTKENIFASSFHFLHYKISVYASENAILKVTFNDYNNKYFSANSLTLMARQQLAEYFAGSRRVFSLPYHLEGTNF